MPITIDAEVPLSRENVAHALAHWAPEQFYTLRCVEAEFAGLPYLGAAEGQQESFFIAREAARLQEVPGVAQSIEAGLFVVQPCALDDFAAYCATVSRGVLLIEERLLLSAELVQELPQATLALDEEQRSWLLRLMPAVSGEALRNLLHLRRVRDLPPLQVWQASRISAAREFEEAQCWLVVDAQTTAVQQERCRDRGYVLWAREELPGAFAALAGWPRSELGKAPPSPEAKTSLAEWCFAFLVLALLARAGMHLLDIGGW